MSPKVAPEHDQQDEITASDARGCATAFAAFNALVMGLLALSFSSGPYSSPAQELYYRYGSIAFFVFGAVVPGAILIWGPRQSRWIALGLVVWMSVLALAFVNYVFLSRGGV